MKKYLLVAGWCLFVSAAFAAEPAALPETTPWKLAAVSAPPKHEWIDEKSPVRSLFYTAEPYGGRPTRVFAYYASPRTIGLSDAAAKVPAVVLVHGGGGTAFREWAELWAKRGYAAIAMDLAGSRPIEGQNAHDRNNRTRLADGGPGQGDEEKFGSVLKEPGEQWPYHAVANVILAHSLIRSFDEVDAERTAVTGISWGGYLTCIVAGVDSRFKAAVPVYGCGHLQENSAWTDRLNNKMTKEESDRWTQLWDPKQYLPSVSMPIFFVNGTNDFAYPLDSYLKSYDDVRGDKPTDKLIRITVNMPHGHPPGWAPQEIGLFIDEVLSKGEATRQGKALPRVLDPKSDGKQVIAICLSKQKLTGQLHYTTDAGPINKRTWISVPATVMGKGLTAPAPPGNASCWFLTVTDERGATVSTRVMIKP